jgi:hypothetical protein
MSKCADQLFDDAHRIQAVEDKSCCAPRAHQVRGDIRSLRTQIFRAPGGPAPENTASTFIFSTARPLLIHYRKLFYQVSEDYSYMFSKSARRFQQA